MLSVAAVNHTTENYTLVNDTHRMVGTVTMADGTYVARDLRGEAIPATSYLYSQMLDSVADYNEWAAQR